MVTARTAPLSSPDDTSWSAGKTVLIVDLASRPDLRILKDQARTDLKLAPLRAEAAGSSGTIDRHPFDNAGPVSPGIPALSLPVRRRPLSGRQRDVLNLIVQGMSNKEIARILNLSEGTVKAHVATLFIKLGVHRRAAVAAASARFVSTPGLQSARPSADAKSTAA